jgi:hypothetical protein
MLPNCIIGGTGRAGTTALFRYLGDHPQVCISAKKEVRFFTSSENVLNPKDSRTIITEADLLEYASYFSHCSTDMLVRVEASPNYLYGGPVVAGNIKTYLPDARLVFILRNPATRFIALYTSLPNMHPLLRGMGFEEFVQIATSVHTSSCRGIDGELLEQIRRIYRFGRYSDYLGDYMTRFQKERIGIFFFEDLVANTAGFVDGVCRFIGIDPSFYRGYEFRAENRTRRYKSFVLHRTSAWLNYSLESWLNRHHWIRRAMRKVYVAVNERKPDNARTREANVAILDKAYSECNRELRDLLVTYYPELKVPNWLQCEAT